MERIVSPIVVTNENDLSFNPPGTGVPGAAFIGPTATGRAFIPTPVTSWNDYCMKFGNPQGDEYTSHGVNSYLANSAGCIVTKVLGVDGYKTEGTVAIIATVPDVQTFATTTFMVSSSATSNSAIVFTCNNVISGSAGTFISCSIASGTSATAMATQIANALVSSSSLFASASGASLTIYAPMAGTTYNSWTLSQSSSLQPSNSLPAFTGGNITYQTATVGLLHPTQYDYEANFSASRLNPGDVSASAFNLQISGSGITTPYSCSLIPTRPTYIGKVFGNNPKGETSVTTNPKGVYIHTLFTDYLSSYVSVATSISNPNYQPATNNPLSSIIIDTSQSINLSGSYGSYSPSYTPWVTSQYTNGTSTERLFQIYTFADGTNANDICKISISNIKFGGENSGTEYGSFTVTVRDIDDTDKVQTVFESFDVDLDPKSAKYIARVIGDKAATVTTMQTNYGSVTKIVYRGQYSNKSKYIRVAMAPAVVNGTLNPSLVPFGNETYTQTIPTMWVGSTAVYLPAVTTITSQIYNNSYNANVCFGIDYESADNWNYFNPLPSGSAVGNNTTFLLYNAIIHPSASGNYAGQNIGAIATGSGTDFTDIPMAARKFSVGLQGGYDGYSIALPRNMDVDISAGNSMGFDFTNSTSQGSRVYKTALDILSNKDEFDINLLYTPGIIASLHSSVVNDAIELCEYRGDVMYVFDMGGINEQIINVTATAGNYDTSYAAAYYPWLQKFDADTNQYIWVPASTLMAGTIAYNDKVGYEWYAPAGLNRGGVLDAVDVYIKLSQLERDDLYENRINPIAQFPNQGIVAWGQKTLQVRSSSLDRINVRRLMINAKKYVAKQGRTIIFDNNVSVTRNRFLSAVNPYFESVQQRQGLYAFKVVMDETNNTPDVIDRNELRGSVWLQPAKSSEFIIIEFNLTKTGVTFGA